jgi:tetratricopeptide (TPR) repeat protein
MMMKPRFAALAALFVLTACSHTSDRAPPTPPPAQRDWVAEIRRAAAAVDSAVEVTPLVDPAIGDLRLRAQQHEDAGAYDDAVAALKQAMMLRPEDPSLWQWQAELSLQRRAWADAERQAERSYNLGPKLGALCVRNWLTMHAARVERGTLDTATQARQSAAACRVAPPIRM